MNSKYKYWLIGLLVLLFAGCSNSKKNTESSDKKIIKVWLIGDSTVADYSKYSNYNSERYPITGWGQIFQPLLNGNKK